MKKVKIVERGRKKEYMAFFKGDLDMILVPSGLLLMLVYHIFLLYRYLKHPHTTVMGFENNDKKAWIERVIQSDYSNMDKPLSVLASNTSAATYLSSLSLTLSSIIGAWIANNSNIFQGALIYGDTRPSTMTLKYISLLTCFLLAFSFFVQATGNFIHASYLISMPKSNLPLIFVENAVIKGGEFWSLGLRALYFALNLLMWFFGPIPMFISSIVMVFVLHYLDTNSTPLHQYNGVEGSRGDERGG